MVGIADIRKNNPKIIVSTSKNNILSETCTKQIRLVLHTSLAVDLYV